MFLAPIVLFVYNRPWHTRQTIEALQKNEFASESELFIFADGPKGNLTIEQINAVNDVRSFIINISGFKSVNIEFSDNNKGLANSVIYGVSKVIEKYGKAIVIEDDIVTHPYFLRYTNDALDYYENDNRIFSIGGYCPNLKIPICYLKSSFIVHRTESWGWATWKNRWEKADWSISDYALFEKSPKEIALFNRGGDDMFPMLKKQLNGEIDSWAIRWDYTLYKNNAYCLRPTKTLVLNIGFDNSGTNCTTINPKDIPTLYKGLYNFRFRNKIKENILIRRRFKESQDHNASFIHRLLYSAKRRLI